MICCEELASAINDDRYYITVDEDETDFRLKILDRCYVDEGLGHDYKMIKISFCPFCGSKISKNK